MYKNFDIRSIGISGTQSEVIELALSYGFQGMSIDMVGFLRQVDEHGLPHARRFIDSAQIKVGSFRLPVAWEQWQEDESAYKQGLAELPRIAEVAAAMGCTRCVTTVLPASDERPYHENFEFHRKRIAQIADQLKPHGIRLGLEFQAPAVERQGRAFQFIHTLDALLHLAKSAAMSNVGVAVDLWQMHVAGAGVDELKTLRNDQIVAVYLSDIAEETDLETVDETARQLPGEGGAIDSAVALAALAELGYDGPVTPRADRKSMQEQSRDAIVKLAGERLDELWNAAGLGAKEQLSPASR